MGNGSTFVLETLIFAGACYAVGSKDFSVYGDDIIIETELFDDLVAFLRFLGFKLNHQKSYTAGPFRESCGVNAYDGVDITPFYLRDWNKRKPVLCHNVNGLSSIAVPFGELWKWLVGVVKENQLLIGPVVHDTTRYVHIPASDAYELNLITTRHRGKQTYIARTLGYTLKTRVSEFMWCKATFLWYVQAGRRPYQRTSFSEEREVVTSRYTESGVQKYNVRKTLYTPSECPTHLYGWLQFLESHLRSDPNWPYARNERKVTNKGKARKGRKRIKKV
jgi:hypothetical protein